MRKDIFDRVVAFKENVGVEGLSSEQKRLVDKLILHGRRNGKMFARRLICSFYVCSKLNSHVIALCIFISFYLFMYYILFFFLPFTFFGVYVFLAGRIIKGKHWSEILNDSFPHRSPFVERDSGPGEEHQEAHVRTEHQVPAQLERGQYQALLHPRGAGRDARRFY